MRSSPNTWQWNLSVQQEILRNTTLELSYVGSAGKDQLLFYDANQVADGDINHNGVNDRLDFLRAGGDTRPAGRGAALRRLRQHRITIWGHDGSTSYHSLQTQLVSRFGRGSQFQSSYTWSKSLGTVPLDDSGGISNDNSITDLGNLALDHGPTKTDRRHIFNASLVLVLPSLENKTGFVKNVFGDWEVATIVAAASGQAISVYTTGGLTGLNGGPPARASPTTTARTRGPGVSCKAPAGPRSRSSIPPPSPSTASGWARSATRDRASAKAPASRRWTSRSTRTSRSARA